MTPDLLRDLAQQEEMFQWQVIVLTMGGCLVIALGVWVLNELWERWRKEYRQ